MAFERITLDELSTIGDGIADLGAKIETSAEIIASANLDAATRLALLSHTEQLGHVAYVLGRVVLVLAAYVSDQHALDGFSAGDGDAGLREGD